MRRAASNEGVASAVRSHAFTLLVLLAVTGPAPGDEIRFDARSLLDKAVTRDILLSADGRALELDDGVLCEDDGPAAGFSYRPNEEKLNGGVHIKKELLIADPRARKATLLVAPGGTLQARINGQAVELKAEGNAGNYWQKYAFDPDVLRAGKNDVVVSGTGKLWIARDEDFALGDRTRTRHPNRSAKSTDGGKTWDYDRLGNDGTLDGEYYVRIFLNQHRSQGLITLPVVDVGDLTGQGLTAPVTSVGPVRVRVQADGERVVVRARSGLRPVPDANWSAWHDLGASGGTIDKPAGRYVEVAIELATANARLTPRLHEVVVAGSPARAADWTKNVRIVEAYNANIVRSSIPFRYEPFDQPRVKELRTIYKLDDVVQGAKSEFESATRLAGWTSRQWDKGHLKDSYPPWDALAILKPHADGTPTGGFCQQYNVVFLQACASFGIVARPVSLGPGDQPIKGGGHEVVEVWSNEHRKWVYVDGNTAWYAVDAKTSTPLSLWELRARQVSALRGEAHEAVRMVTIAPTAHTWKGLDSWPPFVELRLIPRSNFLEERAPLPLNQGMRGWFWTGHHVWTDAEAPAAPLYGNRVGARRNWEWTLNQTRYLLEPTATADELRVHLDTETPGFQAFLADVDNQAAQPVTSGFIWRLHMGKNRLEVRTRNRAGRDGIPSSIVVER